MNKTTLKCQPVFLIGAARSGTKFLRDLIAADIKVCEIPFDVNFVWRRGNEYFPHDAIPPELATESIVRDLRTRLPRMACAKEGQVMLEKTVSNALRIPFLRKVFPEAKYIHLIRDGRSVVESVHRVWDEPTPLRYKLQKLRYFPVTNLRYAYWFLSNARKTPARVWGPRYEGIDDDLSTLSRLQVCGYQWLHCIDSARRNLHDVDQMDRLEVRYEDLIGSPETIERISEFLGVADADAIMQRYSEVLNRSNLDKWRGRWTTEQCQQLQAIIGTRLADLGYGEVSNDLALVQ